MDKRVDPCDDFYQFACGNYDKRHQLHEDETIVGPAYQTQKLVNMQLKDILEKPISKSDPESTILTKTFYQSCMNISALEKLGLKPMQELISSYGGWPILEGENWKDSKDWITLSASMYMKYSISPVFAFNAAADYKNSSQTFWKVDQPELGLEERDYYLYSNYQYMVDAYWQYIFDVAVQLGTVSHVQSCQPMSATAGCIQYSMKRKGWSCNLLSSTDQLYLRGSSLQDSHLGADNETAEQDATDIITLETDLANISLSSDVARNISDLYQLSTFGELKQQYPQIPFKAFFDMLKANGWPLDENRTVIIGANDYFLQLPDVLLKANRRSVNCIYRIIDQLPDALARMYVTNFFNEDSKGKAEDLLRDVKYSMHEAISTAQFMDNPSKEAALLKLSKLKIGIGYPSYIFDDKKILLDFKGINLSPDTYLRNHLELLQSKLRADTRSVDSPTDRTEWPSSAATISPKYSAQRNEIIFPAAILQYPFFAAHAPGFLNYARIGSIMAHEITHGYDDDGVHYDGDGNMDKIYTLHSLVQFKLRSFCFDDQYANIVDNTTGLNLNGERTLSENIADNGGIKLAYNAYKLWSKRQPEVDRLHGRLTGYSTSQLFFINFAQIYCTITREELLKQIIASDVHALPKYRVNVPLQNLDAFSIAFNCSTGSQMNPVDKCILW